MGNVFAKIVKKYIFSKMKFVDLLTKTRFFSFKICLVI